MPLGSPSSMRAHLFGVLAVLWFFVEWMGFHTAAMVLKPLPVLLLLAGVWFAPGRTTPRKLIAAGLLASAVGDVFLAWSSKAFVGGLVSFLIAHLLYIGSFVLQDRRSAIPWFAPFFLWGAGVYAFLWPGLGELAVPVAVYVLVITSMAWRAAVLFGSADGGRTALIGASLFVLSDSILAINKFGHAFTGGHELVMVTYWAAQIYLAKSVLPSGAKA